MLSKVALPLACAYGAYAAGSCADVPTEYTDGSESGYGVEIPTFYPYDDKMEILAFASNDQSTSGFLIACNEAATDADGGADTSLVAVPLDSLTGTNCGDVVTFFDFNMTDIINFADNSVAGGSGTITATYNVTCTLYEYSLADTCADDVSCRDGALSENKLVYTKEKQFVLSTENSLSIGFNITEQDITTEAEAASDSSDTLNLRDLVEVQINGGATIVFKEGSMETLTLSLADISDDADVTGVYQIIDVTTLDFEFDSPAATLNIVASGDAVLSNTIGYTEDFTGNDATLAFILKAGEFLSSARNIDVSGEVQCALADGSRRRAEINTEDPVSIRGSLVYSAAEGTAATAAVSAATMVGVPMVAAGMC